MKNFRTFFTTDRVPRSIRSDALLTTLFRWIPRSLSHARFYIKIIIYTKVWTSPMTCELSFQRTVSFSAGFTPHGTLRKLPHSSGVLLLRSENRKRYIHLHALQRSAMYLERRCCLSKITLKIVQTLVFIVNPKNKYQ